MDFGSCLEAKHEDARQLRAVRYHYTGKRCSPSGTRWKGGRRKAFVLPKGGLVDDQFLGLMDWDATRVAVAGRDGCRCRVRRHREDKHGGRGPMGGEMEEMTWVGVDRMHQHQYIQVCIKNRASGVEELDCRVREQADRSCWEKGHHRLRRAEERKSERVWRRRSIQTGGLSLKEKSRKGMASKFQLDALFCPSA